MTSVPRPRDLIASDPCPVRGGDRRVSGPDAANLAALLGPDGVAHLARRCEETLARARRDGVRIPAALAATVAFVQQLRRAVRADSGADSEGVRAHSWLTTTEAAGFAKVDTRAVRHAVQRGQLAYRRRVRGKGYEVSARALAAWCDRRGTSPRASQIGEDR